MSLFSKLLICLLLTLLLLFPRLTFAQTNNSILYENDFSNPILNDWTIIKGDWNIVNGELLGSLPAYYMTGEIDYNGGQDWQDYAIDLDVNNIWGVDEGITFRWTGNSAYDFNLRHGTGNFGTPEIILWKSVNSSSSTVYSTHYYPIYLELLDGKTYHVRIEAFGNNIKLYLDNLKIVDFTDLDNPLTKGKIALTTNSGLFGGDYVKFDNLKVTTLTATPPAPPGPQPFLDLPWDYQGKGLSFNEAANSINSYFDHEYPLLSSGLAEPGETNTSIISFLNPKRTNDNYSSHDGYDYGRKAKVNIGDPVLAAAAGTATYVNSCGACGNMIVIDHHNGYQTRYLHMQKDGLITSDSTQKVEVSAHQQIGKVGATGNVFPAGDAGAHIHFGVFQDKDGDGNFENNVPDGVTDPFGWQSKDPDPWETYSFFYAGKQRTGNKSYFLWKNKLDNLDSTLTSNGGIFKTERSNFDFPANSTNQNLNLNIKSAPQVTASNLLQSIGSTIVATATDPLGNLVKTFQNFYTLTIDFNNFDLSKFKTDTISIYSSEDGKTWTKETTNVDLTNKTATTKLNHWSYFALMAERLDITPPTTTSNLTGDIGKNNWYRSDVNLTLDAKDNDGGLGTDYTLYRKEGEDWEIYSTPLKFTNEGHYKVDFYSVDKDDNIENFKTIEFGIDKTPPTASANPERSPDHNDWYNHSLIVNFTGIDQNSGIDSCTSATYSGPDNNNASINGNCQDNAGNIGSVAFNFKYDGTFPKPNISTDLSTLWPPNGKLVNVTIMGDANENYLGSLIFSIEDEYGKTQPKISNFGDIIKLEAKRDGSDLDGRMYIIKVIAEDLAGNKGEAQTKVIVPHDQGNNTNQPISKESSPSAQEASGSASTAK